MTMRLIVAFACALLSLTASAQLYSWKDASGKTQYSDEPPPGKTPARRLAAPPAPSSDAADKRKDAADKQMDERKKQKEAREAAAKAERDKAGAEERSRNCDRARGNLQAIESGQARFTLDAKGERVALDGAVREAEIASARKAVDTWCK
jgi:hypothetical protein